ncbi:type II toxin-antitoxin system Phd/YefM family antitoxin [Prosthecomicrobium hirschii]|uniref:type II toxin-antitoxin system Phd/YefM family antitoxin n=1 Tax=Prosthecodimorpha hirschii TaxID=665126 RepID=UPI00221F2434|nr:type II toxin-antitoxin system prevent-host-death family antitoxin [Prosthecomicrobium hirschii]MCW1840540.1 type II toxin-antitoxin system prevent-host-death family antitoxin [Prosthecomicrobium hirschii]
MKHVTLAEARADLAALIEAAHAGDEVVIEDHGKPLARLVAIAADPKDIAAVSATAAPEPDSPSDRPAEPDTVGQKGAEIGFMSGAVWIADDFDGPLPDEILRLIEEGEL